MAAASKRFILFDHDGVLVETEPWYFEATRITIAELGIELDKPDYLAWMAEGRSNWQRAIERGVSEADVQRQRDKRNVLYQEFLATKDIEIAGVDEVLAELAQDYSLAIVTTAKKIDFELIHRNRNIVPHMDFVLANGDYERSKPAPDPYLAALERFNATAEQAIVVEDSERGLRAAVAADIDCAVVKNEFVQGQDFSEATWRIDSLAELPGLLDTL